MGAQSCKVEKVSEKDNKYISNFNVKSWYTDRLEVVNNIFGDLINGIGLSNVIVLKINKFVV